MLQVCMCPSSPLVIQKIGKMHSTANSTKLDFATSNHILETRLDLMVYPSRSRSCSRSIRCPALHCKMAISDE